MKAESGLVSEKEAEGRARVGASNSCLYLE